MYKRKIMDEFVAWKNDTGKKKALVIKGMRQIGKTYIVQAFAKENYENVVYINFKDNESAKKIFDGDFVINRITVDISALIPEAHFVPKKTKSLHILSLKKRALRKLSGSNSVALRCRNYKHLLQPFKHQPSS